MGVHQFYAQLTRNASLPDWLELTGCVDSVRRRVVTRPDLIVQIFRDPRFEVIDADFFLGERGEVVVSDELARFLAINPIFAKANVHRALRDPIAKLANEAALRIDSLADTDTDTLKARLVDLVDRDQPPQVFVDKVLKWLTVAAIRDPGFADRHLDQLDHVDGVVGFSPKRECVGQAGHVMAVLRAEVGLTEDELVLYWMGFEPLRVACLDWMMQPEGADGSSLDRLEALTPISLVGRRCVEEAVIDDQVFTTGDLALLALSAGVQRDAYPQCRHLTFGNGPHACPGSRLSRSMLKAFDRLITDLGVRIKNGTVFWVRDVVPQGLVVRGRLEREI